MRRRALHRQSEWPAIAAIGAVAAALTVWHYRALPSGGVSPPERIAQALLFPIQDAITGAWREVGATASGLVRWRRLAKENERLQREIEVLEAWKIQRWEGYMEHQAMLDKLGLRRKGSGDGIYAEVVGLPGSRFTRRTVDIVAANGQQIRKGDIVRTEKGLVGRVLSSQGSRAKAMLLLDPDAGAAALVPASGATGVVMGPDPASEHPQLLRLGRLGVDATVCVGDKVSTSSMGETYPPGIPIGEIEEVTGGGPAGPKTALVRPYAKFDSLNWVKVIRQDE